ncbi:MAG TPA: DUF3014 domain-containing protein [Albitalea sp.]|nr:DUF3014 domain-containing protein [Albitalea sp.]
MGPSEEGDAMIAEVRAAPPRRGRSHSSGVWLALAAVSAMLLVGALAWWYRFGAQPPVEPVQLPPRVAEAPPAAPSAVAAAPAPVQYPIEAPREAASAPLPTLEASDPMLAQGLADLLGRQAALSQLLTDGFVRRFVATVDNLTRARASPKLWPVVPAPQRFIATPHGEGEVIGADNGLRYSAFVLLLEQLDVDRAVSLYARFYPLFQQAYEELGYPGRYFNDRLIEVIDHLRAAPQPAAPVAVRLVQVQGPVASTHPWLNYEFVDPELEALSAGQKLMVRVGSVNERRLKARLSVLRAALVGRAAPAK